MNDQAFYYDLAKFEVGMVASRSNFLLVFQSMLFGAVASLADKQTFIPLWLLISLGLATSIVWLYLNWLTSVVGEDALKKLKNVDKRLEDIFEENRQLSKLYKYGSTTWIVTWIFPFLTGIVWGFLLVRNIKMVFAA